MKLKEKAEDTPRIKGGVCVEGDMTQPNVIRGPGSHHGPHESQ
jgi:hypothetical protein